MVAIRDRGVIVAGSVGLSLALLAGMAWWLTGGDAAPARARRGEAAAQVGIAAAGQDSARRDDAAPEPASAPRFILGREVPTTPPEIDDEAKAARDAYVALQASVVRDVAPQLEARRGALRQRCWTAELAAGLEQTSFKVSAGFDADGKQTELGVETPATAPGARDIGQCLREQQIELSATAPGQVVTIDLSLVLP